MDRTKKPLGAVTMVYEDYFFLDRWYQYYSAQLGAENLFVYSHGNDPKHRQIAPDANVMHVPRTPAMTKFDRRRWKMLGSFASGMLEFYNWMIVSDVDEIMVVDPDVAPGLLAYLEAELPVKKRAPLNISPLGLELIHCPQEEPLPIEDGETILSRRRIFRPSRNYSKPCLIGAPAVFGPGGHRNTLGRRHLPQDLYLLHLKFCDLPQLVARADQRQAVVAAAKRENADFEKGHPWDNTLASYHRILEHYTLQGVDIALPDFRAALVRQVEKYSDQYVWGRVSNTNLYRIPDRFASVF